MKYIWQVLLFINGYQRMEYTLSYDFAPTVIWLKMFGIVESFIWLGFKGFDLNEN